MPKPKDAEGFEVAGTRYRQHENIHDLLAQAIADYRTSIPNRNFTCRVQGESVTVYCHAHERGLDNPQRKAGQLEVMTKATDDYVKGLKKRFKEMGGGNGLSLTERKGSRGFDLQKVSLNDRWEMVTRRTYDVEGLIGLPEE